MKRTKEISMAYWSHFITWKKYATKNNFIPTKRDEDIAFEFVAFIFDIEVGSINMQNANNNELAIEIVKLKQRIWDLEAENHNLKMDLEDAKDN